MLLLDVVETFAISTNDCVNNNKSDLCSLDFVINRFFMRLFKTGDMEIVKYCQSVFNFVIPSVEVAQKVKTLWKNLTLYVTVIYDDISVNFCCKIVLYS